MDQKKQPKWVFPVAAVVVFGGVFGVFGYHGYHLFFTDHDDQPATVTAAIKDGCPAVGKNVTVTLTDAGWSPSPVSVQHCDRVTIMNASSKGIRPAVGDHDLHRLYPSFVETDLHRGGSVQFQALVVGEFELHDHVRNETAFQTKLIVNP